MKIKVLWISIMVLCTIFFGFLLYFMSIKDRNLAMWCSAIFFGLIGAGILIGKGMSTSKKAKR